ncbi:hypothetical protein AJ80_06900 [Polytolypa hystricis UAMH7299]|uniref:Uncharacterized protein n=1 Tax=Polytolypa hystricis (strain UAMH7299) TaxID=1447883 RepID=A0A2B7XSK6_POLH7|nr:hypothetical protein AJ80_06900 [Polytolypa hystricis UAMH7299]
MTLPTHKAGSVDTSMAGSYRASPVKYMTYGRGSTSSLPNIVSELSVTKAYIITGQSLNKKTPVIRNIESILGSIHAGTFSNIGQHSPIAGILEATSRVREAGADVLISVGGGSPIDAAKSIAYHIHQKTGKWIPSIAVPTTLSVAETTQNAGYTNEYGHKVAVSNPELVPKAVIYDGDIALHTPLRLWTSTGMRALDHAVEFQYHPLAPEIPTRRLALESIRDLFTYLPISHQNPEDADARQSLFLAAYSALFPLLFSGSVGLSHSIGHAIGASYGIPHGITSCLSLAPTVHLKADTQPEEAKLIARIVPYLGKQSTGEAKKDAHVVGDAIAELVETLGLKSSLTEYNVPPGDEEAIARRALRGGDDHPDFKARKSKQRVFILRSVRLFVSSIC